MLCSEYGAAAAPGTLDILRALQQDEAIKHGPILLRLHPRLNEVAVDGDDRELALGCSEWRRLI